MPNRIVTVTNVHPYSGKRGAVEETDLATFLTLPRPTSASTAAPAAEWLVLFEWPSGAVAYTWGAEAVLKDMSKVAFVDSVEDGKKLFKKFNIPEANWPPCLKGVDAIGGNCFRMAAMPLDAQLHLEVEIDTNAPQLNELSQLVMHYEQVKRERGDDEDARAARSEVNAEAKRAFPPITVSAFKSRPASKSDEAFLGAERTVLVQIKGVPMLPMTGYHGYVALDLGNTGSMLAYMSELNDEVQHMQLLTLEGTMSKEAIQTAIRISAFTPADSASRETDVDGIEDFGPMPKAAWEIGLKALTGSEGALILGSKRLLSDPNRREDHKVWLNGSPRIIPKSLPSELFLARLVQIFHGSQTPPRQIHGPIETDDGAAGGSGGVRTCGLAVTCPTTFSDREIAELRKAVYAGWRRALGGTRYKYPVADMNGAITLIIDEASAAAMYFIYRDFLRGPGNARALPYLYPNGINLLVYDCGGGTTDIALLHVFAVYDQVSDRVSQLHIDVIGRTGHRGFGGDNVTEAVFALMKAKVAAKLAALQQGPRAFEIPEGTTPASLAALIEAKKDVIDKLFPTRFNRAKIEQRQVREQAAAVMEMWREAEKIKESLSKDGKDEPKSPLFPLKGSLMAAYLTVVARKDARQTVDILKSATITRSEVDAVVRDAVQSTIDKANGLIRRRMGRIDASLSPAASKAKSDAATMTDDEENAATHRAKGGEIHKVYVLGNASRYGLIRKSLEAQLDVPFLCDEGDMPGRLVFETQNLKGAVAKGAVAALRLQKMVDGVTVRFDNDLIKRLPFDVYYTDLGVADKCLYRKGELYERLEAKEVPPPAVPEGMKLSEEGRTVTLKRQWPDDPKPYPYLTFRFPHKVEGPLLIEYVLEKEDDPPHFQMSDMGATNEKPVRGEELSEAQYVSPPQSGEL